MLYYHVTKKNRLSSIRRWGLRPAIGRRSTAFGEENPGIFLFDSTDAVEDALMGWLGEAYDEDDALVLLTVDLPEEFPLTREAFEFRSEVPILPSHIVKIEDIS